MALYSKGEQDSVKVSVRFPEDSSIDEFYDYITEIRDLSANVITRSAPINHITRIEVIVPKCTNPII